MHTTVATTPAISRAMTEGIQLNNEAMAAFNASDLITALRLYNRCLEIKRAAYAFPSIHIAISLTGLADTHLGLAKAAAGAERARHFAAARAAAEKQAEIARALGSSEQARIAAEVLADVARAARRGRRLDRARGLCERRDRLRRARDAPLLQLWLPAQHEPRGRRAVQVRALHARLLLRRGVPARGVAGAQGRVRARRAVSRRFVARRHKTRSFAAALCHGINRAYARGGPEPHVGTDCAPGGGW